LFDTVAFKEFYDSEIHLILLDSVCLARNSEGCIFRLVTCKYNWVLYEMTIAALREQICSENRDVLLGRLQQLFL